MWRQKYYLRLSPQWHTDRFVYGVDPYPLQKNMKIKSLKKVFKKHTRHLHPHTGT